MAYDIESSLRSHCLCAPSFVVCKPAPRACASTRLFGGDSCVAFHPPLFDLASRGLYPPRRGGQEFSAMLSNDLQSTSITHWRDAWMLPHSPGRGERDEA